MRAIAQLFLRPGGPPESAAGSASAPSSAAIALGVLCAERDARSIGAAVALVVARARRAPCIAVVTWTRERQAPLELAAPAAGSARRFAASLALRGLDTCAAGRLVQVPLATGEDEAVAQCGRALAAADRIPTVLVVGGPRSSAFDELLATRDALVVATPPDADPELARLALAAAPCASATACSPKLDAVGRALAAAGVGLTPALRTSLRPVAALLA